MIERVGNTLRSKTRTYALEQAKGIFEGEHLMQRVIRQRVFEDLGGGFIELADRKLFRFDEGFSGHLQTVVDNVNNNRLTPIILGIPHSGYATGPSTVKAAGEVVRQTELKKFYISVASTLVDGKQGLLPYLTFHGWKPYLQMHQVEPMSTIRPDDENLYTPAEIRTSTFGNGRKILGFYAGSAGLIIFPETGMDAGRSPAKVLERIEEKRKAGKNVPDLPYEPNNDKVAGIQKITEKKVIDMLAGFIKNEVKFQLWLTSVQNDEQATDPSTKSVPLKALFELVKPKPALQIVLSAFPPLTPEDLITGIANSNGLENNRLVVSDALRDHPDILFDYIAGEKVAPYIEWQRRGYYHTHAEKVLARAGLGYYDKLPIPVI